jgi:SAM-dependent methyltransferase
MGIAKSIGFHLALSRFRLQASFAKLAGNPAAQQAAAARYWALINKDKKERGIFESASGPGSTLDATTPIRSFIERIISEYSVETIVDIGCGDWNWMSQVNLGRATYLGLDVVPETVEMNKQRFGDRQNVSFEFTNAIQQVPPAGDLVIIRDVLFHLSNDNAFSVLQNINRSGSKLLLTTTFPDIESNADLERYGANIDGWGYRPINVEASPFNLLNPIDSVEEPEPGRQVRLYRIAGD